VVELLILGYQMSIERATISDEEWALICAELSTLLKMEIGNVDKCRQFIAGVLWLLRGGMEWWMLPPEHGKSNSVFKRYSRWCAHGAWAMLLAQFSRAADLQNVSIDGTLSRAHACAPGYQKESAEQEALGHAKGGFSCKVNGICDAHGLPINFTLTGGQAAECKQAIPLLKNVSAEAVLADKAYDTNEFRNGLKIRGIKAVIPPKSNRKDEIHCDFWHDKERHAVEYLFGKLKYYRRISTR
jgi:transposase